MSAAPDSPVAPELPLVFGADGLIPAVVQDAATGDVLMVAFMDRNALAATQATGRAHYWSRSRGRLWRKGETSGHEQIVEAIHVNCEQNSVLLTVRQIGAVCHDGYPTCYYRRLAPDGTLTVDRERAFDPADVYPSPTPDSAVTDLEPTTRLLFGAYAFLRDHDLAAVSATSGRLRAADDVDLASRLADELRELAGALDGTHRHGDPTSDVLLEGSQVLYWTVLLALRAGATWESLRPDRALVTDDDTIGPAVAASLLRAEADRWAAAPAAEPVVARCHATLGLVGQACRAAAVPVLTMLEADLAALRAKPYLAPYFSSHADEHDADAPTPPGLGRGG